MLCPGPALSSVCTCSIWPDVPSDHTQAHAPAPAAGKCFFVLFLPATFISDSKNKHHVSCITSYVLTALSCCIPWAVKQHQPEFGWFSTSGILSRLRKIFSSFPATMKTLAHAAWEARRGRVQAWLVTTGFATGLRGCSTLHSRLAAPCSSCVLLSKPRETACFTSLQVSFVSHLQGVFVVSVKYMTLHC